jgi:predicted secreted protein
MSTNAIQGYKGLLYTSTDGVTFHKIGEVRDITLTFTPEPIDATSHDSAPYRETISGFIGWSVAAEFLYVHSDVAQDEIWTLMTTEAPVYLKFLPKTGTGLEQFTGRATITNWEINTPNDDVTTVSAEFTGKGPLTKSAQ